MFSNKITDDVSIADIQGAGQCASAGTLPNNPFSTNPRRKSLNIEKHLQAIACPPSDSWTRGRESEVAEMGEKVVETIE